MNSSEYPTQLNSNEIQAVSNTLRALFAFKEGLTFARLSRNFANNLKPTSLNEETRYRDILTQFDDWFEPVKISPPIPPVDGYRLTAKIEKLFSKYNVQQQFELKA